MTLTERQQARLLRHAARIVPPADRAEWSRFWHAELWCPQHPADFGSGIRTRPRATDLYAGLVCDALWLRYERCRCVLRGSVTLCLLTLALACNAALVLVACGLGRWQLVTAHLSLEYGRFLVATPLVLLVTFLTASRRPAHAAPRMDRPARCRDWLRRGSFFAAKAALLFVLAYLLSATLCMPLAASLPNTAAFLQIPIFVVLSVLGLRWSFEDQERRCKHCLYLLDAPARVGRPSHNLLEWSGTALVCARGHGVLSIPELETSWHQTSQWTQANAGPFRAGTEQLG